MSRHSKRKRDEKRRAAVRAGNKRRATFEARGRAIAASERAIEKAWPEIQRHIEEERAKGLARRERYGAVRPQITATFQGQRFVAVGKKLYHGPGWRTFPDFLVAYLSQKLGVEWMKSELAKAERDRHEILNLRAKLEAWMEAHSPGPDGIYAATHTGVSAAYLQLAYDLYTLDHHSVLQEALTQRIKTRDDFQGARYELTVAATFIRAGFDLAFEDERDVSKKHPEFVATHRRSGERIAVEAKSRHRAGVLGYGAIEDAGPNPTAGINRLLHKALGKHVGLPYVICTDLNLPPVTGNVFDSPTFKEVARTLGATEKRLARAGGSRATLFVFTNYPHHYGGEAEPDPDKTVLFKPASGSKHPFETPGIADEIFRAFQRYGKIPNEFHDRP